MKHVKLQNFDLEQIEFLARVSEQIGFFYIIYTPDSKCSYGPDKLVPFRYRLEVSKNLEYISVS